MCDRLLDALLGEAVQPQPNGYANQEFIKVILACGLPLQAVRYFSTYEGREPARRPVSGRAHVAARSATQRWQAARRPCDSVRQLGAWCFARVTARRMPRAGVGIVGELVEARPRLNVLLGLRLQCLPGAIPARHL